jgi:RNA polymerase I-specific transcription initiation factor RRN3
LEDDESAQLQEDVFEIDPFDAVVGEDGDEPDSEAEDEDGDDDRLSDLSSEAEDMDDESKSLDPFSNVSHIQDMVKKLDAILKLLFDHFHCTHVSVLIPSSSPQIDSSPPSTTDSPSQAPTPRSPEEIKLLQRSQFHTLLSNFDRTIIRTFKSRYTQFLLFWYTSLDPEFSDLFQGLLVSKALLEHDQPVVTRAAAASYISSFISRAQFVDREGARRVMGVLCNFIKGHLDAFDALSQAGDSTPAYAHHSIFYAVAQAVFLIFCFRWRDMLEDNDVEEESFAALKAKRQWLPELGVLQRVINSPLQPLKVRLPYGAVGTNG